ncbi:MAG: hypothetical protein H5U39_06565, partial [Deferribacterales bacterium]|nr:hypothetical protein [Deferribacterales bacterium]
MRDFFHNLEDKYFMKYTIELAKKAFEKKDVPVGAIVVKKGDIIGE